MALVNINLNDKEEILFRTYSRKAGKSLSELSKSALLDQIEDELAYETGIKALKDFEKNPVSYSIDDLISELENDIQKIYINFGVKKYILLEKYLKRA